MHAGVSRRARISFPYLIYTLYKGDPSHRPERPGHLLDGHTARTHSHGTCWGLEKLTAGQDQLQLRDSTNPHPGHHVTPPDEQAKGLYPEMTMQVSWENQIYQDQNAELKDSEVYFIDQLPSDKAVTKYSPGSDQDLVKRLQSHLKEYCNITQQPQKLKHSWYIGITFQLYWRNRFFRGNTGRENYH